ncbi:hypothetical protein STCU_00223 [Strigomonas culicis]|uniref:Uncharacterized protein n=1 Tax=Strigomonas culicis TaxID=28005 RepID=S9V7Q8_9TRYP|nr:hypothetical protein STCU_00223 [Strigomonas culicis]|eukprot:EPY37074.1 hypothetical protein STCU_00223 [Strigomonas culicis]
MRTMYAKDLAAHYNFCLLATSTAAITCNRFLYGEWYAVQAEKMNSLVCLKKKCIFMPFMVMGGLACTSFLASVYVHFAYRRFCRKVLEERARIIGEERPVTEGSADPFEDEDQKKNSTVVGQLYATDALHEQLETDREQLERSLTSS